MSRKPYKPVPKHKHRIRYSYVTRIVVTTRVPELIITKYCKHCPFKRYGISKVNTWHS